MGFAFSDGEADFVFMFDGWISGDVILSVLNRINLFSS